MASPERRDDLPDGLGGAPVVIVMGDDAEKFPEMEKGHPLLPAGLKRGDLLIYGEETLRDGRVR